MSIELTNFMSLPHAVLLFDNQNVICPVGYNDSGKSAVTRSMEILWYDAYSSLQAKFITDGRDHFIIRNVFDDGVEIERTKYLSGSSHWKMIKTFQDGSASRIIFDNQLANGSFAAVKGVPDVIQAYLKVYEDDVTGEELNVRRNTNKLLLVATTGGENYKFINSQAQGERLAYASGKLNEDINAKNRKLMTSTSMLTAKNEVLSTMHVFDVETEGTLIKNRADIASKISKLENLIQIAEKQSDTAGKSVISEIALVDTSKLELLSACDAMLRASQGITIESVPVVDTVKLEILENLLAWRNASSVEVIDKIALISEETLNRYSSLANLKAFHDAIITCAKIVDDKTSQYTSMRAQLAQAAEENDWRICKSCGAVVEAEA